MCGATNDVRFGPEADIREQSELFSRELMLLDSALKSFRHTFDPVIEAIIFLNWQYANDLVLPGSGLPVHPLKINELADRVLMRHLHLRVSCQRSGTMSQQYALT